MTAQWPASTLSRMPGGGIRVLTLNSLFHSRQRARLRVIARLLKEADPDVCCLQEVILRRNLRLLDAELANLSTWGPLVLGGVATLTRMPAEGSAYEVYRTGVWFEWGARKGFLTTRLRPGGTHLTVINTHLLANYDEDWSPGNRYAKKLRDELCQLAAAVRQVPDDQLLVVAGDFNVPLASPLFQEFLAGCGLRPAFNWDGYLPGQRGWPAIDNVLYRAPHGHPVRARARTCFGELVELEDGRRAYPSDHLGVLAELEW